MQCQLLISSQLYTFAILKTFFRQCSLDTFSVFFGLKKFLLLYFIPENVAEELGNIFYNHILTTKLHNAMRSQRAGKNEKYEKLYCFKQ